jgi:hypothetical protein
MLESSMFKVALLFASLACCAAQDTVTWRFDNPRSIGGHAAAVEGQPRIIETAKGRAIEFNGVADAIFLDVHPLADAAAFTWEVVFRPDRGGKAEQRFFHLQENGTQNRMLFEIRVTGDRWYLDSFMFSPTAEKALMDRTKLHPLGEWHAVAMTYDGKWFRNYVNGVEQNAAEVRLTPNRAGRTSIGVRINRIDYFKGAIRESRFTRRALTPAEMLTP